MSCSASRGRSVWCRTEPKEASAGRLGCGTMEVLKRSLRA